MILEHLLDHWSSDRLWEMARDLSLQQRTEILGAPAGYEHLFLAGLGTKEVSQAIDRSWFVLVHDVMSPVNIRDVVAALQPHQPFGAPFFIRPTVADPPWDAAARSQRRMIEDVLEKSRDVIPRFAIFSLAPIPLVTQLGFLFSDRVEVRCFQYHRNEMTWRWPELESDEVDADIKVTGQPSELIEDEVEVVIRVSLSARIAPRETRAMTDGSPVEIDISVAKPDVLWLRHPSQLDQLRKVFGGTLSAIRNNVPSCRRIHLFYAGPAGGAVVLGQQINPRMNPPSNSTSTRGNGRPLTDGR